MRTLKLLTLAATAAAVTVPATLMAQDTAPVVQTQANPTGPGEPSATPPNPDTASTPVPPTMPADPSYQAGAYKGALSSPPAEAMNKSYPICTSKMQDSCQNPGEGGAPGRSRAIHHYRPKN